MKLGGVNNGPASGFRRKVLSVDIGRINLSWCFFCEYEDGHFELLDCAVVDLCPDIQKDEDRTKPVLVKALWTWLHDKEQCPLLSSQTQTEIVCETQLGQATKNHTLAMALYMFALENNIKFAFVHSLTKFRGMPVQYVPPEMNISEIVKAPKTIRKNAAVKLAIFIAKQNNRDFGLLVDYIITLKKQDDIGDSFCQGVYYLSLSPQSHERLLKTLN